MRSISACSAGSARSLFVSAAFVCASSAASLTWAACGGAPPVDASRQPAPIASASAASMTSADRAMPSDVGKAARGLDAKDNDAAIVAAAKKALACKFDDEDGFDGDCDGFKAWGDLDAPFEGGKNETTVVNMLEDADQKVRLLAAMQLEEHGESYKKDVALTARVIAVGEAEKLEVICVPLGGAIGEIDLDATKLFTTIASLAKKHAQAEMRGRITARLLDHNPSSDDAYRFTVEMLADESADVRGAAVESLPRAAATRKADSCTTLAGVMKKDADGGVAADAARQLAKMRSCSDLYDTLLDTVDQREKSDKVHWFYSWALWSMCEDPAASKAHRGRAIVLGKRIAEDKKEVSAARLESLDAVVRCDPAGAWRPYLARFKGDKVLGTKATRLLANATPATPNKKSAP